MTSIDVFTQFANNNPRSIENNKPQLFIITIGDKK